MRASQNVGELFVHFLMFGHCLLIVPYNIRANLNGKEGNCWRKALKIFSGILQSVSFLIAMAWITYSALGGEVLFYHASSDIRRIMLKMVYVLWIVFSGSSAFTIWRRQVELEKCVESLRSLNANFNGRLVIPVLLALSMWYTVFLSAEEVFFVAYRVHQYQLNEFFYVIANDVRSVIAQAPNATSLRVQDDPNMPLYCIIAITLMIAIFYVSLISYFGGCLCLMTSIVFYTAIKKGTERLKKLQGRKEKLELAQKMLELSECFQKAFSQLIFVYCFSFLPFYSFKIQEALRGDWTIVLQIVMDSAVFLAFMFLGAAANSQVHIGLFMDSRPGGSSISLLSRHLLLQEKEQRVAILHQISNNEIGVKGSTFTITYFFVGSIVGSILTYCVVIFQFQQASTPKA